MERALTKEILLSNNYWVLNKTLVEALGLEPAFLISTLAEAEKLMADKDGWFYQTIETLEEKTTLTRRKQEGAIRVLEDAGVIKTEVRGLPPKRHFKINYNRLTKLFVQNVQIDLHKTDKTICAKRTTNKESINKQNNNKEERETLAAFMDLWNDNSVRPIRKLDPRSTRARTLQARIKEYGEEEVKKAFRMVGASGFLQGKSERGWTATFDWVVKAENFIKVIEGNYDDEDLKKLKKEDEDKYEKSLRALGIKPWGQPDDEEIKKEDERLRGLSIKL